MPSALSLRRTLSLVALLGLIALAAIAVAIYRTRGAIGAMAAMEYLRGQGVPAEVRFDRLDARGFSGAVTLGPSNHPDLTVKRLEGGFEPAGSSAHGLLPRLVTLTLEGAHLHGIYDGRHLTFGSLQGLIASLGRSKGGGPAPDVLVKDSLLTLKTPWGELTAHVGGRSRSGHITDAAVRLTPSQVNGGALSVADLAGVATLHTVADQATVDIILTAAQAADGADVGRRVDLKAHLEAPAGVLASKAEVPVRGSSELQIGKLQVGGAAFSSARAQLRLDGRLQWNASGGSYHGRAAANGQASGLIFRQSIVEGLTVAASSEDVAVELHEKAAIGGGSYQATLAGVQGRTALPGGKDNALSIERLQMSQSGRMAFSPSGANLSASGHIEADGGLTRPLNLGGMLGGAELQPLSDAINASLKVVRLEVSRFEFKADRDGYRLVVPQEVSLRSSTGTTIKVSGRANRPLASLTDQSAEGGFVAAASGPGLPKVDLDVASYRLGSDPSGLTVNLEGVAEASGAAEPFQGARLSVAGTVDRRRGVLTVSAERCGGLSLNGFRSSGSVVIRSLKAQLCPGPRPWLVATKERWSLTATLKNVAMALPAAGLSVSVSQGDVAMEDHDRAPPAGTVNLGPATVKDETPLARFKPLVTKGQLSLANDRLVGDFTIGLVDPSIALGRGAITYDLVAKRGQATLKVDQATLAPGGLQPANIAASLGKWATNAQGTVSASADLELQNGQMQSSGVLRVSSLDFKSPVGPLTGLNGAVVFSSLIPLSANPGQTITADRLASFVPLTELKMVFGLSPKALSVQTASAAIAGGYAGLSPMQVPLAPNSTVSGALTLKDVDLEPFIDSTSLSNAVTVQAHVTGVVPFTAGPAGVRFTQGVLSATGPGRLTIHRQALTGAVATAGSAGAQPNAVQDFAYQALEDLAFESLSAEVASRPEGRLGMLLRVKGRHDPPTSTPTRLNLLDLARGHAFDKPIPLPKGTPVDLTLDGSLNFDELLAAYGALGSPTGSAEVQPNP